VIKHNKQGQRKGQIKEGDPLALAIAYWGAVQGVAEPMLFGQASHCHKAAGL